MTYTYRLKNVNTNEINYITTFIPLSIGSRIEWGYDENLGITAKWEIIAEI
jgi:hypothetical protein